MYSYWLQLIFTQLLVTITLSHTTGAKLFPNSIGCCDLDTAYLVYLLAHGRPRDHLLFYILSQLSQRHTPYTRFRLALSLLTPR